MFGPWEWLMIVLIAVLCFGPGIFIRAASSVGKGVSEFKKAVKDDDGKSPGSPAEGGALAGQDRSKS